jgi:hypothetical protein
MRLRSILAVAGAAAALIATSAAPGLADSPGAAPGAGSRSGSAVRTLDVTASRALPALRQNSHVVGRDNGQSAGYAGRSVWIFDDTILRDPDGFLSNSGATTADLDADNGIDLTSDNPFTLDSSAAPGELMPLTAAESAFQKAHAQPCAAGDAYCGTVFGLWPGPVVADPARHRIIFSYGKLCRGAPDGTPCASGFVGTALGTGFAQLDMLTHKVSRIDVVHPDPAVTGAGPEGTDPALMFAPGKEFGSGSMVLHDGMLYAYGRCDTTANSCALARVPAGRIQDRLAWRYYAGPAAGGGQVWSADPDAAVTVGAGNGPAGSTVQYVPALHGYLDTYMGLFDNVAHYQTAPEPWGPWTPAKPMFTGLPTNTLWDYAMFAHPEYARRGGLTQYFTYYRPEDGSQQLVRVDFDLTRG